MARWFPRPPPLVFIDSIFLFRASICSFSSSTCPSRNQSEDFAKIDTDNLFTQICPLLSCKTECTICVNSFVHILISKFYFLHIFKRSSDWAEKPAIISSCKKRKLNHSIMSTDPSMIFPKRNKIIDLSGV